MDIKRLIYMANQIATYFRAYPEEEAIAETATHLRQFWDPRMRRDLLAHLDAGGAGLSPIAHAAAKRLQASASSPA